MAGELSKRIGEEGEKLARSFLDKIGWKISEENYDLKCALPDDHNSRKNHGIDFIVAYDCPLAHETRRNILISMKNSHLERTRNESSLVKEDIHQLDQAIQCYKKSVLRAEINQDSQATSITDTGILIKINKDQDSSESFLLNLNDRERIDTSSGNDLHFIENSRFDIVDLSIQFLRSRRSQGKWHYFYPLNTQTYAADIAKTEGRLIPVHHLVGSPLTFRWIGESIKEFLVFSPTDFDRTTLERLIGLAHGCSQGWASKITLVFPLLTIENLEEARSAMRGIKSQSFAQSIEIESLDDRSRTP